MRSAPTSATSRDEVDADHIIYTGPIDEYFDFRFGKLPYRSLKFDHQTLDQEQYQPVADGQLSRPQDVPYTRISEYKHLTGQQHPQTTHHLRISVGRGRSLLPDPAAGESGAVQALRGARRRDRGRDLRRPARDLSLLQHGPDRRPGAGDVPPDGREAGGSEGRRRLRPRPHDRPAARARRSSCGAASNARSSGSATNFATRSSTPATRRG